MDKKITIIPFLMIGLFVCIFTPLHTPGKSAAQEIRNSGTALNQFFNNDPDGLVIGLLHTRDKIVTIRSAEEGLLYSVVSKEGMLLAANLTEEDLYMKYPELRMTVESGYAIKDATLRNINLPVFKAPMQNNWGGCE